MRHGEPPFEFSTPTHIVFGAGAVARTGRLVRGLGARALVVHGRSPTRAEVVLTSLREAGVEATPFAVSHEPDTALAAAGAALARRQALDVVVGIGGGSVLDGAKAIAALATNDGDIVDYLEVVGQGRPLPTPACRPSPFRRRRGLARRSRATPSWRPDLIE
jgi:alcohol dehydrogenase class IV